MIKLGFLTKYVDLILLSENLKCDLVIPPAFLESYKQNILEHIYLYFPIIFIALLALTVPSEPKP